MILPALRIVKAWFNLSHLHLRVHLRVTLEKASETQIASLVLEPQGLPGAGLRPEAAACRDRRT